MNKKLDEIVDVFIRISNKKIILAFLVAFSSLLAMFFMYGSFWIYILMIIICNSIFYLGIILGYAIFKAKLKRHNLIEDLKNLEHIRKFPEEII